MSDPIYTDKDYYLGGGTTGPTATQIADAIAAQVLMVKPPVAANRASMLTVTRTIGVSTITTPVLIASWMSAVSLFEVQFIVTAGTVDVTEDGATTTLEVGDTWHQRAEPGMLLEEDWSFTTDAAGTIELTALGVN